MSNRPQQVNSSNESSVAHHHYLHSPNQDDDFSGIAGMSALQRAAQHHGSSLHQGVGGGLPQDSMSNIFSSNQDLLMRSSRQGLMDHHLPMAMGGGSNSLQSNSLNPATHGLLGNHPELQYLTGFGGGVGGQDGPNGRPDMPDADLLSHDQLLQRRLQQQQMLHQQQQSRLLYETMGSAASRSAASGLSSSCQPFSSARDMYPSMNMNSLSSYGSPGGHLDSALHRQNEDPSFLLNRNAQEEKNQLLQQMNFQLHLQEQELALRKSQLERAGLSSMSVASLGMGQSYLNPMASVGPVQDCVEPQQQQPENNQEVAGRSELIFANSSIAGITPSRSTSVETTPNGKVFYFPCRARGMDQGHNFDSAYFTVPDGLDHGADLYCSYRACRAEGCKFRYCAVCKAPAARRNFRKRHGHGEHPKDKGNKEETCTEKKEEVDPQESSHETSEKNISEVLHDATESSKLPEELKTDSDPVDATSVKSSKVRPRPDDSYEELLKTEDLNNCWDKLLISRPDASEKPLMDAWILKVTALNERMNRQKARKFWSEGT